MDEKLLNAVVFTGLYRPKKCWCNGYQSNQHYDYCVPFMHEMGIVMVDTYHIHHSGDYEDFLKLREEEKDFKRVEVPFVTGLCYKYYSIIESVEELERNFDFVLDLKEYHPADDEEFAKCTDENKLARVPLWFECNLFRNGYKLVKNLPKTDINKTPSEALECVNFLGALLPEWLRVNDGKDVLDTIKQTLIQQKKDNELKKELGCSFEVYVKLTYNARIVDKNGYVGFVKNVENLNDERWINVIFYSNNEGAKDCLRGFKVKDYKKTWWLKEGE